MSLRLVKPTSVAPMKDMSSYSSPASTQTTVLLAESTTTTEAAPMVMETAPAPVMETRNYMTKNYLWVYLLIAIIVLVIVFWFAVGCNRNDDFEKLRCKGCEWLKGGSGRTVMGLFLVIAVFLAAWAMSTVAGYYRCGCDMNRSNMVMAAFGLLMLLVLVTFIMFYRGSFTTAYYLALFTLLLALLITISFFYFKFNGPALAMLVFFLWTLLIAWCFHKVSCQNPNHHGGHGGGHAGSSAGSSGSGSGSSGSHGSPRPNHHPHSPSTSH